MKILKKIISIFSFVFLLSGCNEDIKTYEYVGESENWKAVYKYEVHFLNNGDNRSEEELRITYLGENEKIPIGTVIESTYKIGQKSGSQTIEVEEISKPLDIANGGGGVNTSILQGSEIGVITVSWDGNFEEIEIKNTKE